MLLKKFQNLSVARKMWALFLGLLLCNVLVAGGLFSYLQNVEQRVSAAVQATDKRINPSKGSTNTLTMDYAGGVLAGAGAFEADFIQP